MDERPHPRIVEALEALQHRHGGCVPRAELPGLAAQLGVPTYHLYGVVSFFPHFRLDPPPALDVRVCTDMSCHLRGGGTLRQAVENAARSRAPGEVTVTPVSCLGRCDGAPALAVNDTPYWDVGGERRAALLAAIGSGAPLPPPPAPARLDQLSADPAFGGAAPFSALRRLVESGDVDAVLRELKAADLRGLGGAGFRTALKWELVRKEPGDEKYVVCNADESEPATIKDRGILTSVPHLLIEGMTLAGLVTGARRGIVYIRHEYEPERRILERAIEQARRDGVIGDRVLGSSHTFHLEVFVSPGGYICGEESALLEAIEGRRAQPRLKPPFPVTAGLFAKPTVINNVETLAFTPIILVRGADWWRAQGANGCAGLKFIGISGHVRRPGVFEVPMGTSLLDAVERLAGGVVDGKALKAVVPSGASSGFLPARGADVPLDFAALEKAGSMLGSGAIVAVAQGSCMVDLALNVARFFARESCGKCWPCRVGSEKLVHMLETVTTGSATPGMLAPIDELSDTLRLTSICGLGQVVPNPIRSVLTHFRDELDAHLVDRRCPDGTCSMRPATPPANGGRA